MPVLKRKHRADVVRANASMKGAGEFRGVCRVCDWKSKNVRTSVSAAQKDADAHVERMAAR